MDHGLLWLPKSYIKRHETELKWIKLLQTPFPLGTMLVIGLIGHYGYAHYVINLILRTGIILFWFVPFMIQ